jgi:hypothetical protein
MYALCQAVALVLPVALPSHSLVFMMVYVWSRNFPQGNISLMGLVRPESFLNLPAAACAIDSSNLACLLRLDDQD